MNLVVGRVRALGLDHGTRRFGDAGRLFRLPPMILGVQDAQQVGMAVGDELERW
ncbi:MAG: hypothetical protein Q8M74_05445 [Chloroflexota bacterium]|nr:hypothetical protein [Chloroflexota bacterium]